MFQFEYVDRDPSILAPGPGSFVVEDAVDRDATGAQLMTKSVPPSPKIRLKLMCEDSTGKTGIVYEHISTLPTSIWKLKKILMAIGKGHLYQKNGQLDVGQMVGGVGECVLAVKPANGMHEASTGIRSFTPKANEAPAPGGFQVPHGTTVAHGRATQVAQPNVYETPAAGTQGQDLPF